jgi:hypothetical protein
MDFRCMFGFHDIDWHFANDPDDPCRKEGYCQRDDCNRYEDKKATTWEHKWGAYQYESEDSCRMFAHCTQTNCCQKQYKAYPVYTHRWGEWQYDPVQQQEIRFCLRCGTKEGKEKE